MSELTVNWEKTIRELQTLGRTWTDDLEKLKTDLESVVHDLTHLEIELKIEGEAEPHRKTEYNLITGDITVTLPKGTDLEKIDIEKINTEAVTMAREELEKRVEKLIKIIEILINTITPGGSLKSILDLINTAIEKLDNPT